MPQPSEYSEKKSKKPTVKPIQNYSFGNDDLISGLGLGFHHMHYCDDSFLASNQFSSSASNKSRNSARNNSRQRTVTQLNGLFAKNNSEAHSRQSSTNTAKFCSNHNKSSRQYSILPMQTKKPILKQTFIKEAAQQPEEEFIDDCNYESSQSQIHTRTQINQVNFEVKTFTDRKPSHSEFEIKPKLTISPQKVPSKQVPIISKQEAHTIILHSLNRYLYQQEQDIGQGPLPEPNEDTTAESSAINNKAFLNNSSILHRRDPSQQEASLVLHQEMEAPSAGSRLREQLKNLLANPDFRSISDVDEMTDILMAKLAEVADYEIASSIQDPRPIDHDEYHPQEQPSLHGDSSSGNDDSFRNSKSSLSQHRQSAEFDNPPLIP